MRKARQLKKNLKKSIGLLNNLYVEEFDFAGEEILYINVYDDKFTRATINKICALQHLNRDGLFQDINEYQKEFSIENVPQVNLVLVYEYMRTPKNQEIVFTYGTGFSLKRTKLILDKRRQN